MRLHFVVPILLNLAFCVHGKQEICYPNIGCFNYGYPFYDPPMRPLSWPPQSPSHVNPRFLLHTRHNPLKKDAQILDSDDASTFTNSFFDPAKETKFICHGFIESGVIEWDSWMTDMVKEFLNYADYNVIRVVWGGGSLFPYTQAMANTRIVGAETSRLMDKIREIYGISASTFHFIGHSLGAHIGGYTGERQPGLGRITGLDPAGPGFEYTQPEVRLDPTDAVFVDTIHTDAQPTLDLGFGINNPVGHMDFFPNSGRDQPGCDQSIIEDLLDEGLAAGVVKIVACNHLRSHELFSDSINKCPIYAFRCPKADDTYENFVNGECFNENTVAVLGYHSIDHKPPPGVQHLKYFAATTDSSPFCMENAFHFRLYLNDPWFSETFKGWAFVTLIGSKSNTERTKLNRESVDFKPGTERNFIANTNVDPGELSQLQFYWEHDFEFTNPFDWPIFDDVEIYIPKIEIKSPSQQKSYTMCNKKPRTGINANRVAYFELSIC